MGKHRSGLKKLILEPVENCSLFSVWCCEVVNFCVPAEIKVHINFWVLKLSYIYFAYRSLIQKLLYYYWYSFPPAASGS